ncbi:hypothetical protein ACIBK8_25565 [Streptomyces sp. NPDC050161]|uniref:hypothetical protein n=1 Tax=Streptomyces sp. NPDC050161 TaxID=3365604 RepID=UPI003793038C
MPSAPDFRLKGYTAADAHTLDNWLRIDRRKFVVMADHHTECASYFVLFDRTAIYGVPGEPQFAALHIIRDPAFRTFQYDLQRPPLPALAQSWLIARRCPRDAIRLRPGLGTEPADDATRDLEDHLVRVGHRYRLVHSYTSEDASSIAVMLEDPDDTAPAPFRVLVREGAGDHHTMRQGAFTDHGDAIRWVNRYWFTRTAPQLPPPPARIRPAPAQHPASQLRAAPRSRSRQLQLPFR